MLLEKITNNTCVSFFLALSRPRWLKEATGLVPKASAVKRTNMQLAPSERATMRLRQYMYTGRCGMLTAIVHIVAVATHATHTK